MHEDSGPRYVLYLNKINETADGKDSRPTEAERHLRLVSLAMLGLTLTVLLVTVSILLMIKFSTVDMEVGTEQQMFVLPTQDSTSFFDPTWLTHVPTLMLLFRWIRPEL